MLGQDRRLPRPCPGETQAPPLQMLDFGTGQSKVPEILRRQGHHMEAVDVMSPLRPHPDRLTGDIRELQLPENSLDLSFSYKVFEHLPDPRPILDELFRVTKLEDWC